MLNDSITLLKGDETVDVNVLIDESAARPFEGEKLVNYIDVQLVAGVFEVGDEYSVKVDDGIKSYSGTEVKNETIAYTVTEEKKSVTLTIPEGVEVYQEEELLKDGDRVYQNDRIQVIANAPEGFRLGELKVNKDKIQSGDYYTVGKDDLVITVKFTDTAPVLPTSIELSQTVASLKVGQTLELSATVMPEDAEDKEVIWSSENDAIATVSSNGVVITVSAGQIKITAKVRAAENVQASCRVIVKEDENKSSSSSSETESKSSSSSSETESKSSSSSSEAESKSSSSSSEAESKSSSSSSEA